MKHFSVIFATILFLNPQLFGQNLVINPGFEQSSSAGLSSPITEATGWNSPNQDIASLFGSTPGGFVYDQYGSTWEFKARSGSHVAAMNVYGSMGKDPEDHSREYIQGQLTQPLEVGKKYYFSFWVHYHCEGANNIGITFLPEQLALPASGQIDLTPVAWQHEVTPYLRTKTWTQVTDSFIAYEAYSHFIIGNFFSDDETRIQQTGIGHHLAYIDDVEVIPAKDISMLASRGQPDQGIWTENLRQLERLKNPAGEVPLPPVTVPFETIPDLNNPMEIEAFFEMKIYFDLDSYSLDTEDQRKLDLMAELLVARPDLKVMVLGHASGEGGSNYNQRLSDLRARAVRSYLVSEGADPNAVTIRAFGETLPVEHNNTESTRSRNRRVEFRLLW